MTRHTQNSNSLVIQDQECKLGQREARGDWNEEERSEKTKVDGKESYLETGEEKKKEAGGS